MRYKQIKPQLDKEILDEVKMTPSALMQFANSPEAEGMLIGIEWELCVPGVQAGELDWEYDYDRDERAYDIDDIIEFFSLGEFSEMSRQTAERARNELWVQFLEWQDEKIYENLDSNDLDERIRKLISDDVGWKDYYDDALAELGDEASDDEVENLAREKADEIIDEIISSQDRQYQRAYDEAREEMVDELRQDGDYDESAWLDDLGIMYMSDAEREWNFAWPHRTAAGGGEIEIGEIAEEFGDAIGTDQINYSAEYHGAKRDGRSWIIETDSSIDAREGDGGLEFVSPPMPLKQGLESIEKVYAWAKSKGCYTNQSTGLHMNISVPGMRVGDVDYVKLALFMGDEYVLKKFGREYNNYTQSAMKIIRDRIRPEDAEEVLKQIKRNLNSLASKIIHSGITNKYTSINTKFDYVEFRGPGGDYLNKDPFELINTALRLAIGLRIATDPEAYKQEYAKKLYKLIEQDKEPDDITQWFSQYAMGELTKDLLIIKIKNAQRKRQDAKINPNVVAPAAPSPNTTATTPRELPQPWERWVQNLYTVAIEDLRIFRERFSDPNRQTAPTLTSEHKAQIVRFIDAEIARRESVQAQQSQLIQRDDPVTSNDPEARVPSPTTESIKSLRKLAGLPNK